jgi:hypothetical protein
VTEAAGLGNRNANWRSEGHTAFAAKVRGRRIFRTTLQAEARQRISAASAEIISGWIFGPAL